MTEVKIVGGKLTVKKEPAAKGNKPSKYPYPQQQYDALLRLAKSAGLEAGTKAQRTKAVNQITNAIITDFIASQDKPKAQQV